MRQASDFHALHLFAMLTLTLLALPTLLPSLWSFQAAQERILLNKWCIAALCSAYTPSQDSSAVNLSGSGARVTTPPAVLPTRHQAIQVENCQTNFIHHVLWLDGGKWLFCVIWPPHCFVAKNWWTFVSVSMYQAFLKLHPHQWKCQNICHFSQVKLEQIWFHIVLVRAFRRLNALVTLPKTPLPCHFSFWGEKRMIRVQSFGHEVLGHIQFRRLVAPFMTTHTTCLLLGIMHDMWCHFVWVQPSFLLCDFTSVGDWGGISLHKSVVKMGETPTTNNLGKLGRGFRQNLSTHKNGEAVMVLPVKVWKLKPLSLRSNASMMKRKEFRRVLTLQSLTN